MATENGGVPGPAGARDQRSRNQGDEERPQFQSNFKILVTCLGCAVGTGNIWRFPRMVANNSEKEGGLVFLIVWLLFLFLWSIPMLVVEYGIGRYTKKAVIGSFRQLFSDKVIFFGAWIVAVSFLISCYYAVILGWCFYYTFRLAIIGLPDSPTESINIFKDFAEDDPWLPVITTFAAILLASISVVKGVKTIEKVSTVLVPCLLLIIMLSFCGSLFLPHAGNGIEYLFKPDWKSFGDIPMWIDALSQNAFDTGAGSGLMLTFSSYMSHQHGIVRYSTVIPVMNNVVSLICAVTIFGGVFSTLTTQYGFMTQEDIVDIMTDSGPGNTGLTFIWLPVLFNTLPSVVGRIVAVFFFLCLSFAGLTSLISNMELFTLTLTDFGIPRKIALPGVFILLCGLSMFSATNIHILNNQDFVWGFGLVINGLILVGVVIAFGPTRFQDDVINNFTLHGNDWKLPKIWKWVIIILVPVEAVFLLVSWAVDLIADPEDTDQNWDELGEKTFLTTMIEWSGVFLILFIVNMIVFFFLRRRARASEYASLLVDGDRLQDGRSYDSGRGSEQQTAEYAFIPGD